MFRKVKVAPETTTSLPLDPAESSDSDSSGDTITPDISNNPVQNKATGGLQTRYIFDWDEMLEDLDILIEESEREKKGEHYKIDGKTLKKTQGNSGLYLITEELMKSYGLEFLNLVTNVVEEALENGKITLSEVVNQMQYLDYQTVSGHKLIIWVEDDADDEEESIRKDSFGRLLLTEMMLNEIVPQIVIPSHDFDEDVLLAILEKVQGRSEQDLDTAKNVILKLLRVGFSLYLAAARCKIIIIDADTHLKEDKDFLGLLDFAEELGHKVLYLRNNLTITDKPKAIKSFLKKIKSWIEKQNEPATNPIAAMAEFGEDIITPKTSFPKDGKDLIEEDLGPFGRIGDGDGESSSSKRFVISYVQEDGQTIPRHNTSKHVTFSLPGIQLSEDDSQV